MPFISNAGENLQTQMCALTHYICCEVCQPLLTIIQAGPPLESIGTNDRVSYHGNVEDPVKSVGDGVDSAIVDIRR